ncbi:bifunctional demethylmenaquinone methyltransferase/2-methoxy-6-polyprenyl-1,4-benzoquinol methylase UbiE [Robiginitalea sp. M366]|uniref:bifunctional demethylmenaquinone methyltransferase/2-methoxy-6-polyprenyl-1,4-benzoquinol methylase UbiE n=1 Tax=Robiginitalea aestuariiviva TaxID=3036903 RepID=UPI00240E849C|nr:bifunctional demethylmenaquinone methyltransferase/2-methoxy-6-polyprenyl-1,4-benzoquinol methylase UbiE [Robiginitalea aestuariiviva]MDG1570823.1 bifunctional demethylmenaquinone methyltransferase/2-methoxy-6-polyprenyl-1,4-benzoquinol methylase UbiE [Robiginitalea aestuariiviva]
MSRDILPYKDSELGKKQQVRQMFDTISGNYDGLNRVITLGLDQGWRRRLVRLVSQNNPRDVLDIATGTGDLALALAKAGATRVVGLDLAPGMLEVGRKKVTRQGLDARVEMVEGDSEALEFPDASFDAVTVAFGVRNFENLEKGLAEIYRVLRPGGTLAILETSVPEKQPFRWGYQLYGRYLLPRIGKWFSRDGSAYAYLSESAAAFPYGQRFNNILGKIGFIGMKHRPQTFGVAAIYVATK